MTNGVKNLGAATVALEGSATNAVVCPTFGIKRSTLIDSLARVEWSAGCKERERC